MRSHAKHGNDEIKVKGKVKMDSRFRGNDKQEQGQRQGLCAFAPLRDQNGFPLSRE
jgi:hypothetical protein